MGYFSRFPMVTRRFGNNKVIGADLTRRTGILANYKADPRYFLWYNIQDGESPEILADRLYDNASLSWVILMFNDVININEEWPLDYQGLIAYCQSKYTDIYAIKEYRAISTGLVVDSDWPSYDRRPITIFEYETEANDAKRRIKLLVPDYVSTVVSQHNKIVSGGR